MKYARGSAAFLAPMMALLLGTAGCETVEIIALEVGSIQVEPDEVALAVGEERQLSASLLDANGNPLTGYTIQWISNRNDVALVGTDGVVHAVGVGIAQVSAHVNGTAGTAVVEVMASPSIAVSPQAVTFAAAIGAPPPPDQVVRVTNAGPGTLDELSIGIAYAGGQPAGWLDASLAATAAPTDLRLAVAADALAPGRYEATVTIASAHPGVTPRPLPVSLVVGEPLPVIAVDRDIMSFSMVEDAQNPEPAAVAITNAGGGTLDGLGSAVTYSPGQPTGWLFASLSPSTAPATLTLGVDAAQLEPGDYSADVAIVAPRAANSPLNIKVMLAVQQRPSIDVSPISIRFQAREGDTQPPATQSVLINNTGGGTLSGIQARVIYPDGYAGPQWLLAQPVGTTAPTTVTLTADPAGLAAGSYTADLRITAPGASNSATVPVRFDIGEPPPELALNPETVPTLVAIAGSATAATATISISNSGGGDLTGLAASATEIDGTGWLDATIDQSTRILTISASAETLATGTYTGTVKVSATNATNSPVSLDVKFEVLPPPSIVLSADTVRFQTTYGIKNVSQQVQIHNGGGGTLQGITVTDDPSAAWLTTNLSDSSSPAVLDLDASTNLLMFPGLADTATVVIDADNADNGAQEITVILLIGGDAPELVLSSGQVTFSAVLGDAVPDTKGIQITEAGGAALPIAEPVIEYEDEDESNWLTASLSDSEAPATLTIAVTRTDLTAAIHTADVIIRGPDGTQNSPDTIDVTFEVSEPPEISLSPETIPSLTGVVGSSSADSAHISISNAGGGVLTALAATPIEIDGTDWLHATVDEATLILTISASALALTNADTYTGKVEVSAMGAVPDTVDVTFVVSEPAPEIALSPETIPSLTAVAGSTTPETATVSISNSGGGVLTGPMATVVSQSGPAAWLTATLVGDVLTISASALELDPGTYTGTVEVTATGASNSPVILDVTFEVTPGHR